MKIQTNLTQVLVTGSRILELEPVSANKFKLEVLWNNDLSGILLLEEALQKVVLGRP